MYNNVTVNTSNNRTNMCIIASLCSQQWPTMHSRVLSVENNRVKVCTYSQQRQSVHNSGKICIMASQFSQVWRSNEVRYKARDVTMWKMRRSDENASHKPWWNCVTKMKMRHKDSDDIATQRWKCVTLEWTALSPHCSLQNCGLHNADSGRSKDVAAGLPDGTSIFKPKIQILVIFWGPWN